MDDDLPVSVVVVSRGRPDDLALCLTALGQVRYHPFEVIVVADGPGRRAAAGHPLGDRLKILACDDANISLARNIGISEAAGEIVAFIDDDAIAEPGWLSHLMAPFSDTDVTAVGGYVLGRNGISLQWGARTVDREGWHHEMSLDDPGLSENMVEDGRAVRTEGTNMAVRLDALTVLGGFDQVFRYYYDDTDLNMRMAQEGAVVALVPEARVFHRQTVSEHRGAGRVPTSLREIGRSTAAFLTRYAPEDRQRAALSEHRAAQRKRLLNHMVAGRLVPGDVKRLLAGFDVGASEGRMLRSFVGSSTPARSTGFRPLHRDPRTGRPHTLSGWAWQSRRIMSDARETVENGGVVEVFRMTPTALFHRRRYIEPGIWLQTGGLFGRSDRKSPLYHPTTFRRRVEKEKIAGPMASLICQEREKC